MFAMFQNLDQQIAHLKDQYQELKARTGLETNYFKKQMQVYGVQFILEYFSNCKGKGL